MYRNAMSILVVTLSIVLTTGITAARASVIGIDAIDSGTYQSTGLHDSGIENYLTGTLMNEHHSFFVFDLTGVTAEITAATLNLFNPGVAPCCLGYVSPDSTETFALMDVSTPVSTLVTGGSGVATFDDLGTGTTFGSYVASAADNGTTISIALNAAGIAALNAALGSTIAFGGVLTTLSPPTNQYVFGFSTAVFVEDDVRRLDLTVVPEPASLTLAGLGVAAALLGRRRARSLKHF
jgi:hypothetical protein